jgi:predicted DCC family thiol-disulfide oxidoreductase YuxK
MSDFPTPGAVVVYDGDCPFCSSYVALQRLRESIGPVKLVNARDGGVEVDWLRAHGYDLNEGMALVSEGQVHYGPDAVHAIALLSTTSNLFNKITTRLFASRRAARLAYPILRAGRNMTLRLLGRKQIA